MAIIVNKEEKRRAIALASKSLLLEHGIKNITISKIAECAGVGKGTIYEYFSNKEDIVFEIITTFIADHEKELLALVDTPITTREKLFHFLNFLFENEIAGKHLNVYQEFLAISLSSEPEAMLVFSEECRKKFTMILDMILEAGKASGEIEKSMAISSSSLTLFATGLVVDSRLESCDIKKEIDLFLDMILPSK